MKNLLRALALVCGLLALAAGAGASSTTSRGTPLIVGVAEDAPKYPQDGGASIFNDMQSLGFKEDRYSIYWDSSQPTTIQEQGFLDRSVPVAAANGINLVFDIYPTKALALSSSPDAPQQFCSYVGLVAQRYPTVRTFILLNEPNQPRFMQPQFDGSGNNLSAALAEKTLALCYDTLKGIDPSITVVGLGLSPRGNDDASAANNVSTSPVRFIKYLGDAYRASGRTTPIMDQFGLHLYPNDPSTDTPDTQVQWPNASLASLDRLKQSAADAFCGTAQPVFAGSACGTPESLKWKLDEIGWQTEILDAYKSLYTGSENIKPTTEAIQAQIDALIFRYVLCDSTIAELLYFHLIDETDLGSGFQSGFERPDGSQKPSFDAVKSEIAKQALDQCAGSLKEWQRIKGVITDRIANGTLGNPNAAGNPFYRYWGIRLPGQTQEDAAFSAAIIRVHDQSFNPLNSDSRAQLQQLMDNTLRGSKSASAAGGPQIALSATGTVKAYYNPLIKLPAKIVPAGYYVYALDLQAWANPSRETLFTSKVFAVGNPAGKGKKKKH